MLCALEPLLDAGASIDTAFSYAVEHNRVDAARLCLRRGVDPTAAIKAVDDREARRLAGTPEGEDEAMWELEEDDLLRRPEVMQRREEMKALLAVLRQTQK
nr:hypothetical protein B0A51_11832 [Rachicladosporium sp. CCFEE 5018]